MAYRYDMRDKTPQQQAIVRARDAEGHTDAASIKPEGVNLSAKNKSEPLYLAIDMDHCPLHDCVLYQDLCGGCKFYIEFKLINGQRCINCGFKS